MPSVLSKVAAKELVSEQQVDAIKRMYTRNITEERFGTQFPQLSHQKKLICAVAVQLPPGLSDKALHREICKVLKLPVPAAHYTEQEMRDAVVVTIFARWTSSRSPPSLPSMGRQRHAVILGQGIIS